jgi:tetratricopeptide (TPR) repeat protein
MKNKNLEGIDTFIDSITPEIESSYKENKLETREAYINKAKHNLRDQLKECQSKFANGYKIIIEKLKEDKKDVEHLKFTPEQFPIINEHEELGRSLLEGMSLQTTLGIPNESVFEMYDVVIKLFDANQFEKCEDAAYFLIMLDSKNPDFWIASGCALEAQHKHEAAIFAYKMAIVADPDHIQPYLTLARCHLALNQQEDALNIFELAKEVASGSEEHNPELEKLKAEADAFIKELQATQRER